MDQTDQAITAFETFADGRLRRRLDGGFVWWIHPYDIASRCTEACKEGAVQVLMDLGKTVRSPKSRKLEFGRVMEPESE